MAKLVWDKTGERYYETGVNKTVLFPQKDDGTYDAGVAWSGMISINLNPDGADPNELYADNIKYAVLRSAETLSFGMEAYMYPDEWAECDGSKAPESTKGLYVGQQPRRSFGLAFRTEIGSDVKTDANAGYKLHIIYNATASPSDRSYETINDNPDAGTMSWDCETTAVEVGLAGYKPTASLELDTTKMDEEALAHLAVLEKYLFGSDADATAGSEGTDAMLPTPAQVIAIMQTGALA